MKKGKERENFTPLIEKHIKRNTTYADVVRWHYEVGNEFSTSNEKIKPRYLQKAGYREKDL